MKLSDFDYHLPEHLIAHKPLDDRSASRLLVLDKNTGGIQHSQFSQIIDHLTENDVLVFNQTRVIPARLIGQKTTGASVEVFLLKEQTLDTWECMVRPAKRLKKGAKVIFGKQTLSAEVIEECENGHRIIRFDQAGQAFKEALHQIGEMPLPPYIKEKLAKGNEERYQTVFSKIEGSVAAPTAGLHFTDELLSQLTTKGIQTEFVTLHVGLGTFLPVQTDDISEHVMHSEEYTLESDVADRINQAKAAGKRIISVGTTSTRVLESCWNNTTNQLQPGSGDTNIFIKSSEDIHFIDGLITNFHLPKSTLMMLVSALAGKDHIMDTYQEAIDQEYGFFSFGDAMLIK